MGEGTGGTRFRLFPQFDEGFDEPETVMLSPPRGSIGDGPADATAYVVDASGKRDPYDPPTYTPPWRGPRLPVARPGRDGHFDRIPLDTPEFLCSHLYGTMRFTLDVWEWYLRHRVVWWHALMFPRMELIPVVEWQNAQSGPGFIETGVWPDASGVPQPLCLNFDVIAHETGHAILFSQIGIPAIDRSAVPYLAFHESFADLVALIGSLHFRSTLARLLDQTGGNLYVLNLLSRIGEVSANTQLRIASNEIKMADVEGITLQPDGTWYDPCGQGRNAHAIAEPLTGAVFDILVELYQNELVLRGVIPREFDARDWSREEAERSGAAAADVAARAMRRFRPAFRAAMIHARGVVAHSMAHVMVAIAPNLLTFERVAALFLEEALRQGCGPLLADLLDCFLWRGIDPRPFMRLVPVMQPGYRARRRPAPALVAPLPARPRPACPVCDPSAGIFARRLMPHRHGFTAA